MTNKDYLTGFSPELIIIEQSAQNYPLTRHIKRIFSSTPTCVVKDIKNFCCQPPDKQKNWLGLAVKKGDLVRKIKRCSSITEFNIFHAANCPMDCDYCYLHSYFEHEIPVIHVNQDDILKQIEEKIQGDCRFHAGEFSDALIFDHFTGFSQRLIKLFSNYEHAILELRTKTDNIENLLKIQPPPNVVVSWTLNPEDFINKYERDTATLEARLLAASQLQKAGYKVGLRFDPIIHSPDWRPMYKDLIKRIFSLLDHKLIESCMLGSLRFSKKHMQIIRERRQATDLFLDEFVECPDGKLRYFSSIRLDMYRYICKLIKKCSPCMKIELCMEDDWVWQEIHPTCASTSLDP